MTDFLILAISCVFSLYLIFKTVSVIISLARSRYGRDFYKTVYARVEIVPKSRKYESLEGFCWTLIFDDTVLLTAYGAGYFLTKEDADEALRKIRIGKENGYDMPKYRIIKIIEEQKACS